MPTPAKEHYATVIRAIADGRAVPFLGAGVNLYGRPTGTRWRQNQNKYLPNGGELSEYLADYFNYQPSVEPDSCPSCHSELRLIELKERQDLLRVSQYVALNAGTGALYDKLRELFNVDYPPTLLHQFFATLPKILRKKKYAYANDLVRRRLVIVTTNYDDVLERAFRKEREPFHVVSYMADMARSEQRGKCFHWPSTSNRPRLVDKPNKYRGLSGDTHPVIVKIHGAIDRMTIIPRDRLDSFVITEDHYIDYLTRTDISNLLPQPLPSILTTSNFLFLGYSLRDWNLRVILYRLWEAQRVNYPSWAIQLRPQVLDQKFWAKQGVEVLEVRLEKYIKELNKHLQDLPPHKKTLSASRQNRP
jgi:hypothetical protein